ncbi:MAG: hypothetical protein OXD49_11255 [Candidatus Poribacteria bacterium]|nr:hypothetical protein [Candidatus Poribacteria bacterium]
MLRQELSGHCPDRFISYNVMKRWVSLESRRLQTSWKFANLHAKYAWFLMFRSTQPTLSEVKSVLLVQHTV